MFWKDHLRSNYVPLKKYPEKENHESQFKCTDINICICFIIHLVAYYFISDPPQSCRLNSIILILQMRKLRKSSNSANKS